MKNVLLILNGNISKYLIKRMLDLNNNLNQYNIVYTDESILPKTIPANFLFYKFDPTSYSKLSFLLKKDYYQDALIAMDSKEETLAVIENIRKKFKTLNFTVYDKWNMELNDPNIKFYRSNDVISNGLVEQLPNIPVFAQNIGLRKGEIMEIKIPFGSNYAYRYIGSISQKDWKIVALYRAGELLKIKPSLILKPSDVIIVVGKPYVLTQVYSAIAKTNTQFPMPFGSNIYLYIDLYIQSKEEAYDAIEDCIILHKRMKNHSLILKITRPTKVEVIEKIESLVKNISNVIIDMDYHNIGIQKILKLDKVKYDIGMIVLTKSLLKYNEAIKNIVSLKLPVFKIGFEHISSLKNSLILLNENKIYEQISPVLFDISNQLKIKPKIFDIDPIGDKSRENLISHLNNLSKIFNQNIMIVNEKANPVKRLEKEHNILQILPLEEEMFKKRRVKFLTTNSDHLSFDMSKFNQLLIPVIDDIN